MSEPLTVAQVGCCGLFLPRLDLKYTTYFFAQSANIGLKIAN